MVAAKTFLVASATVEESELMTPLPVSGRPVSPEAIVPADVLAELRRMPLDKIAQELLETMKGANRLANAPELMESVRTLDATLKDFQKLTRNVDQTIVSLASSTEKTLAAGRRALQVADPNSPAAIHLENALKELSAAARAIPVLANSSEQHPEAVLVGMSGRGG